MGVRLESQDLMSLEEYARQRVEFRNRVMAHKRKRRLQIGAHVTLHFEDRLTIQYQVQEMLRAERIFEAEGIRQELEAYNALIPDGANLKATLMIEYPDAVERKQALARLIGIEDCVWLRIGGHDVVRAVADEDALARETDEKTSAVHFLRFELAAGMAADLTAGKSLGAGIDHPAYRFSVATVPEAMRASLAGDLR